MYEKHIEDTKKEVIRILLAEVPEKWEGHAKLRTLVNKHADAVRGDYKMQEAREIANELLQELEPYFVYDKEWNTGDKLVDSEGKTYMIVLDTNPSTLDYKLLSLETGVLLKDKQYWWLGEMKEKLKFWSSMGGLKIEKHIAKDNKTHVSL